MILDSTKIIGHFDVETYCWNRLAKFLNSEFTASIIQSLHQPPAKQALNVRRQAEEIKHCLMQAREYFRAAQNVTLATRPVLLYYGVMSMALAEILLKQTANSRLERLRQEHPAHGLTLNVASAPKQNDNLADALSSMVAKVQTDGNANPRGTFEVWRRSAREYPIAGRQTTTTANGSVNGFGILMGAVDQPFDVIPKKGISLKDCLTELPYMADVLEANGMRVEMVRATMKSNRSLNERYQATITVHPQSQDLIDSFGALVKFQSSAINDLTVIEYPRGYSIVINDAEKVGDFHFPSAITLNQESVNFSCSKTPINEFGNLYIALHICGNFSRYYPDIWLRHVEMNSALALAIEELCAHAMERLPLLMLSELTRTYHVLK